MEEQSTKVRRRGTTLVEEGGRSEEGTFVWGDLIRKMGALE